jgi:DtxR family Mn-dependent transcriptional regulator
MFVTNVTEKFGKPNIFFSHLYDEFVSAETQHRSPAVEDYLKAIYSLTVVNETASTTDLSARLGVSSGSVSAMISKLADEGLVTHEPYRGAGLTDEGRNVALRVVRRHRLIELFLAKSLDMPWEDLHDEAEILEHAMSDRLIDLIAEKLGDPQFDPHGDPIPSRDLTIESRPTLSLAALEPGDEGIFVRVSDSNPDMLRFLTAQGIGIGDRVEMIGLQPFDGPTIVRIAGREHGLGLTLARAMRVSTQA